MTTFYEQFLARPTVLPTSAANLRTEPSAKYVAEQPAYVPVAGAVAEFAWDPASLAVDDGIVVIRPNDVPAINPGRFIRIRGFTVVPHPRQTLFVDGGYTGPIEDGGIATPYKTITAALAVIPAAAPATFVVWQVLVAPGDYPESILIGPDRSVIIQPLSESERDENLPQVFLTGGGGVTWTPGGSVAPTGLTLRGISAASIGIGALATPAGAALAEHACIIGAIAVAAGAYIGTLTARNTIQTGAVTLPDCQLFGDRAIFLGALSILNLLDNESSFQGNVTVLAVSAATPAGIFIDSSFSPGIVLANPSTELYLSGSAMRNAARAGVLNAPAAPGPGLWRGDAGYYAMQHSVRPVVTVNTALNLADEYVACDPAAATTITLTLPDANLFAGNPGTETNGATLRVPARHLHIRNIGHNAGSIVAFATLAGQRIDSGALPSGFLLLGGESVLLIPMFDVVAGAYSWEPLYRFGRNYQSATVLALAGNATGVFVARVTLVTPPLRGVYRVMWRAVLSGTTVATDLESRMTVDAVQLGIAIREDIDSTTDRIPQGGGGLVTFVGVARTLVLEWRNVGGATANIEDAWIELWKVN